MLWPLGLGHQPVPEEEEVLMSIGDSMHRKQKIVRAISDGIAQVDDATDVEVICALGDLTRYWGSKMLRDQHNKEKNNASSNEEEDDSEEGAGQEGRDIKGRFQDGLVLAYDVGQEIRERINARRQEDAGQEGHAGEEDQLDSPRGSQRPAASEVE